MSSDRVVATPTVVAAHDEWLRDRSGREYFDLCMGYGSVWLGHGHPVVSAALTSQLADYAAPGYLPTPVQDAARDVMAAFVPETHFLGGFYSTGMEAIETALRAVWAQTGRRHLVGFAGSEHGRSFVASAIGGVSSDGLPEFVHVLPSFSAVNTGTIEAELRRLAEKADLAAIVIEPIQMTAGGYAIPDAALRAVFRIAREYDIATIFDETLTGLYRCGTRYFADAAGEMPDILVLGKGMANGFPCSALVLRKGFAWNRERVRPSSTFWNHPLACAAVGATLGALSRLGAAERVARIASVITGVLSGCELRGRGAMWCLGVPDRGRLPDFVRQLLGSGVVVSYYDRYVRLLPPITVDPDALSGACDTMRKRYAHLFG